MSIQEAIKLLRLELGLSQEELARRLDKTFITINRWENGKAFPSRSNSLDVINLAINDGASENCVKYLREVLQPETMRSHTGGEYGFPDIDKDFLVQLADNLQNALYVIDAETYELKYVNKIAQTIASKDQERRTGISNSRQFDKVKDKKCYKYFGDRDEPCPFCPMQKADFTSFQDTIVSINEEGCKRDIRAKKTRLKGRDVYVVYMSDMTAQMEEQEALFSMTNDVPVGVGIYNVYLDWRMELVFMNHILYQMIGGLRREQLLTQEAKKFCLVKPSDRERLYKEIKESIAEKREVNINIKMRIREGNYHSIHLTGRIIKRHQDCFTYYCLFNEI